MVDLTTRINLFAFALFKFRMFPAYSLIFFFPFVFVLLFFRILNRFQFVPSTSQRIETNKKPIRMNAFYKILIAYQMRSSSCGCCSWCCQRGEGSQMMMNALSFVRDVRCLEWEEWEKPMKTVCVFLIEDFPWKEGIRSHTHTHTQHNTNKHGSGTHDSMCLLLYIE